MSASARIVQINISPGRVPKRPVPSARVTVLGLQGDAQRDRTHHGGPDRALCLYSQERIQALQTEGHPITPESIGENLTIEGADWKAVTPGRYLLLGAEVIAQITSYTAPCRNITASFRDHDHSHMGPLTCGDPVRFLSDTEAPALIGPR